MTDTQTVELVTALRAAGVPAEAMPAFGPHEVLVELNDGDEVAVDSENGEAWRVRLLMVDSEPVVVAEGLHAGEVPSRFVAEFDDMYVALPDA